MDDNQKIPPFCMEELKIEEKKKSREYQKKRCSALSEEEKQKVREKERERKRKQRANYSEAEREERKKIDRERKFQKRASYSEEQKEQIREKERTNRCDLRRQYNEEQKDEAREKSRQSMFNLRAGYSEEQQEASREKSRQSMFNLRAGYSEEQQEASREKSRQSMSNLRAGYSEEQQEASREKSRQSMFNLRAGYSEEQQEASREKSRQSMSNLRAGYSEEQKEEAREKARFSHQAVQQQQWVGKEQVEVERDIFVEDVNCYTVDLCQDVETEASVLQCQRNLRKTVVASYEKDFQDDVVIHKILVCIVCDCCIIGNEPFFWISRETLKFHENVLSSTYYYRDGINPMLRSQYSVNDEVVGDLLLSPRARKNIMDKSYMCCQPCYEELQHLKKRRSPPKYAISNGFAIGHLPEEISKDITPLVNNLVAPVRAFNYFISFNGGREQKITGNFTFFAQDVSQNIGAIQHTCGINNNPSIYIVLLGSFTPVQIEKIKKQGSISVQTFEAVYKFLHTNNCHYIGLPCIGNVPRPRVEEIRFNSAEEENSTAPELEGEICWRYWFPNVEDPTRLHGTFQNQCDFAKALFIGETPTLIYHPSKVMNNAKISQLCPIAFPFGIGDVDCKRTPKVTEVECLKHYLKLSLPQFQEGQTVLIIHHIFQRRKSFLTGITKCNVSSNGSTIADQLAEMTVNELDEAITQMKNISKTVSEPSTINSSPNVTQFLRCIRTSCTPIGYTNEAAGDARNKMFALWMTFGPPSLLFTFSPCDECSFKMQLYATGKALEFPSMKGCVEVMSRQLGIRKALRVQYPGACAREFDSLLRIVVSNLIGWEGRCQKHKGIFGKILAHSIGVEEQGRTTLHGHIILFVHRFQILQQQIFSDREDVREKAIAELQKYMSLVLSSLFDINEDEIHGCLHKSKNTVESKTCDGQLIGVSLQNLREMRHRELLKKHRGKMLTCNKCHEMWDSTDVINGAIEHMFELSKHEVPTFWPENVTFPLQQEMMELLALRFPFDMMDIPVEAVYLRRLLQLIVMYFFNTHDWKHRKSCFKKGVECRFHIPQKPCETTTVLYKSDDLDNLLQGIRSQCNAKWYHHDGTFHKVCGFEIQPKRKPWDAFVNINNPVVSKVFGYNNNVCMGSINTLFYCTLYTSKSNQEDETYPFLKACEAVSTRIKKLNESEGESDLSARQVGLRRLLSGINAHLSSCVVSATMAWYLVTHGTRFHFSHDFKPLLLSQLEAWYEDKTFSRRIRHKKRFRRCKENHSSNTNLPNESQSEVWFDSDVNNYIFRPKCDLNFKNMSFWEYQSKYDMITFKPDNFMPENCNVDKSSMHFRFEKDHPGYQFSCLAKRKHECIPQLYYSNKFPDIELLEILKGDDVDEHVRQYREIYALKALLLFYPFEKKEDLMGNHSNLWNSLLQQKRRLIENNGQHSVLLYKHSIQILQNIQDLLNVRKVPDTADILESCTCITETMINGVHVRRSKRSEVLDDVDPSVFEAQIEQLSQYVNLLSQESSVFNNNFTQHGATALSAMRSAVITIKSTSFENTTPSNSNNIIGYEENGQSPYLRNLQNEGHANRRSSVITVLTKALQSNDVQVLLHRDINSSINDATINGVCFDICSLDEFAHQNNLDSKQSIAFQSICSSFMLSFLTDLTTDVSQNDREFYQSLLESKGAKQQLLLCVTGPGGSGKSHIVKCCRLYCKSFCDAIGKPFDFSVFPVTATSNSAASLLQGKTIHTAALINNTYISMELSSDVNWTTTKVLIIDEISLADKKLFPVLDKNLRILTGNRDLLYGGIHIVFIGDFMQLAPVNGSPIFSSFDDIHWHGSLNGAVFLDQGNHRFRDDPEWGEILQRVQVGDVTEDDITKINQRLLDKVQLPDLVDCTEKKIVYGCFTNKRRNEITNACFLQFVSQNSPRFESVEEPLAETLLIKGLVSKENKDVGPEFHKLLWGMCGDNNISVKGNTKIDPCLKLIKGSPLMINSNTEKARKLCKGTMGNYVGVRWKEGCTPQIENYNGYKVFAANIYDLECLIMKLACTGQMVELKPEEFSVEMKLPGSASVIKGFKMAQFAVNMSLATTGHKLQGMTMDILILAEISLVPNWLYVVLSRVTTLKGLYLMQPLSKEMFKRLSRNLREELLFLRGLEQRLLGSL